MDQREFDPLEEGVESVKASLKAPSVYRELLKAIDQIPRKRGRPLRRRLARGGVSRSTSDLSIITFLLRGKSRARTVQEICKRGVSLSTAYRRLSHLESRGLVTKQGSPQKWSLTDDRRKLDEYILFIGSRLAWARHYTLRDFRRDIELRLKLAEGRDAAIREYLLHGSPEGFTQEQKRVDDIWSKFIEVEKRMRETPYLDRIADQKRRQIR